VGNYSAEAARSSELAVRVTNRTRTLAANASDEPPGPLVILAFIVQLLPPDSG
jgi:hypothetical protein